MIALDKKKKKKINAKHEAQTDLPKYFNPTAKIPRRAMHSHREQNLKKLIKEDGAGKENYETY